jgi:hypothetical protein
MKIQLALIFVSLFIFSNLFADDFAKKPREVRCKDAGGEVAGHGVPKSDGSKKGESYPLGPIDCTCGGKRFNPLQEGDICKGGKILTALEHYCADSNGTFTEEKGNNTPANAKGKWPNLKRKCLCGSDAFMPTKTSVCTDGKVNENGRK